MNGLALIGAAWIGFWLYWIFQFDWRGAARETLNPWADRFHGALVALGVTMMLLGWRGLGLDDARLWSPWEYLGAVVAALGLGLSTWGGVHLGRLWTNEIGLLKDQPVVMTGPYKFLRHPVYAGLGVAAAGTLLAAGTLSALMGFLVVSGSYGLKLWREEKWLPMRLKGYGDYAARVKALMPRVW